MSLIFSTTKLTTPGVYTYTVPAGVGEIEMHLWGAGGGDGARGSDTSVVLDPGKPAKYIPGDSIVVAENTAIKVPDYVTSVVITAAGGGGGGGGSDGGDKNHWIFGLGGGAARVVREAVAVEPGQVISTVIGAGGRGGGTAASGAAGTATVVKLDGAPVVEAIGGVGGRGRAVGGVFQPGEEVGIPVVTNNTTILAGSGGDGSARGYGSGGSTGSSGGVVIEWEAVTIPAIPSTTTSVSGSSGGKGAAGGYAYNKVRVYPGDTITVAVGKRGVSKTGGASLTTPIDFSGGDADGNSDGGGGGGATVVLINNVVVAVAGGGGGGGAGGRGGYSLTPTTQTNNNSGQRYLPGPGVENWTVPAGVTSINVDLVGAGGGGGGNDSHIGYSGSAGGSVTGTIAVNPGDVVTIGVGQGGRPGSSGVRGTGGGAGGASFNGVAAGGNGGNAGGSGTSGGGGGGGGATAILVNGNIVAVAAGGGGGGGGGNHSNGNANAGQFVTGGTPGAAGANHPGDGGGGGGGGGGINGGTGGAAGSGDNGGYTGSNGNSLVPSGGSQGTGGAGGSYNGGAGVDGTARISWVQAVVSAGASIITVASGSSGIGENGIPATNSGVGYNTRGKGQSSGSGADSAGGGGGGGYYGGRAGVSGAIGGGGQGGTNYGTVVLAGSGETPGGTSVAEYPEGRPGQARLDGAIVFNFIKSFTLAIKKSNEWKLVDQAWVKIANTWKPIYNGWVKVDGVWKLLVANPNSSVVAPTYSISANVSSVNEGLAVSFTISTTDVPTGHIIPYTAFGLTSDQLLSGSLTGSFTIGSSETITFVSKLDQATTGPRTFTVELDNLGVSDSVIINDVSLTPLATLTANVASANEGNAVSFTISTTGVANGTVIPYVITGITNSDLSVELVTGNLVIGSDTTRELVLSEDLFTEGVETMTMRTTGVVSASASITVNDTSVTPIYTLAGNVSLLEEYYPPNKAIRYTLTTNAPVGETVAYTITGITSADLSSGSLTGNFVVGTTDYIDLAVAANTGVEGPETLLLSLNNGYGRIATQVSDYYYMFTPTSAGSASGNAYAGKGMPSDYRAAYHGTVIWPNGGNNRYIGVRIVPQTNKITIQTTCDNAFNLYLNQSGTPILTGGNWGAWYTTTIDVVPGVPIYLSWYNSDSGGLEGTVARITDANGAVVALSNTGWVSN